MAEVKVKNTRIRAFIPLKACSQKVSQWWWEFPGAGIFCVCTETPCEISQDHLRLFVLFWKMFRGDKNCWNYCQWCNPIRDVFLNAGSLCFSLPLWCDLSGTISRWWKCAALPLSLMEATVCYDDGIARVAKFTENEIHVIVRQSQTLPRGGGVCVCLVSQGGWRVCTTTYWRRLSSCFVCLVNGSLGQLCSAFGCIIHVHMWSSEFMLMDQQDQSVGLKCETSCTQGRQERIQTREESAFSTSSAHVKSSFSITRILNLKGFPQISNWTKM